MQRDFKIGLTIGLVVAVAALLWLATRPTMTMHSHVPAHGIAQTAPTNAPASQQTSHQPPAARSDIQPPDTLPSALTDTARYHVVRKGETLSQISKLYYGSTDKWQRILQANRPRIKDANRLKPGAALLIPD